MARLTKADWRSRQSRLNTFTHSGRWVKGVGSIRVDGVPGASTRKRISEVQFWLGWQHQDGKWSDQLAANLRAPRDWRITSRATVQRGIQRRTIHNAAWLHSFAHPGVVTFDHVRVAKVAVPILLWSRNHGWDGVLVSGWRSAWYSEHLCIQMCGQPTCPGRCAGKNTNHRFPGPTNFAVDVTFYDQFSRVVAKCPYKPKIFNALPIDPVHFSPSGR